ncbi:hypothetical protein NIES2100_12610 [Calothrix sp. NIES-2100]|uniref:hypothetical protein n=1 Tax=Calothrix sp. NIES-2100 TaxID=1954172 RepID=UPI000B617548|nr:hypothetical protein NIES2100_12610 [Calothrix sp. NIES-2100]
MVYIAEVKVYVWQGKEGLDFGHASMKITGVDGSYTYVSFYPGDTPKKEWKHLWKTSKGNIVEKYDEDCYQMKRNADKIIVIPNLPNPKNYSIAYYKNIWQTSLWKLFGTNCCHVVINNLQWMSGIEFATSQYSWHPAWSPQDVINYANHLCSQAFPKPSTIEGLGYTISGSTVKIRADKLVNNRKGGTSGTLKLKLWATSSPNDIANINDNGHIFAETQFDTLEGGYHYPNIEHNVPYQRPPAGTYYIVATLHEYETENKWPIYDWVSVNGQITSKPLIIEGTVGYTISGSTVEIRTDKLIHNRKGITSGTLKLQLWATSSPNDIANINENGHVFAETQFGTLKEMKSHQIKNTVPYQRPPAGTYYVVATLHEYETENKWTIHDWVSVNGQITSKPLIIEGTVGYTISGSTVEIRADKLIHNRKGITSGTLKLQLWATSSPNDIANINENGHVFAETQFGTLKEMKSHQIKNTVPYQRPPAGTYYVVATLHEYETENKWTIHDWVSFNDRLVECHLEAN